MPKFRSCHKAIMVTTGRAHCIHNCILCSLFIQFEHSLDWVESLVKGVHYWKIASLTACSLSTLVTPQCNLTMCNRTSCSQVQEFHKIFVEWWVKPYYVSPPSMLVWWLLQCWIELEFVRIPALAQCFLVWGCGFVEGILVTGNFR